MFISDKGNHLFSPRSATITQMLIGRRAGALRKNHNIFKTKKKCASRAFISKTSSIDWSLLCPSRFMCVGGRGGGIKLHISDFACDFGCFTERSLHILLAGNTNKLSPPPSSFYGDKKCKSSCCTSHFPPSPFRQWWSNPKDSSRKKKNKHPNEARMWNLCCSRQIWITSSAHQCRLLLLLLLLYMVGWTNDALWIRGMMSCIVAPHVGATLSDRQMWPYSFRVIRLDR